MNYVIRKKEKRDCQATAHIVTVSWNETYKGIVPEDFLNNLYKNEEKRAANSVNNFNEIDHHQFVLEIDDKIVGFIKVGQADDIAYGEIYALYILNAYKGNGLGKKLVDAGIAELKNMGFKKMLIGCLDGNESNSFYKHIGGSFLKTRIFEKLNLPENVYVFENL